MKTLNWLQSCRVVKDAHHIWNCHIPGVASIVVGHRVGGLSRLFIVPPGQMHECLRVYDKPFLCHSHKYDFMSTTLVGSQWNIIYEAGRRPNSFWMKRYCFRSGVSETGPHGVPKITIAGQRLMYVKSKEWYGPGSAYYQPSDAIHRVMWEPGTKGWFACLIDEYPTTKLFDPHIFSEKVLRSVPDADNLYIPMGNHSAKVMLNKLINALELDGLPVNRH